MGKVGRARGHSSREEEGGQREEMRRVSDKAGGGGRRSGWRVEVGRVWGRRTGGVGKGVGGWGLGEEGGRGADTRVGKEGVGIEEMEDGLGSALRRDVGRVLKLLWFRWATCGVKWLRGWRLKAGL